MTDIRVAAEQARVALTNLARGFSTCPLRPLYTVHTAQEMDEWWMARNIQNEAWVSSIARAALASLEAALAALPGDKGTLDALTDALLAFEAQASYLSHPAVAYHGTANGDNPKEWERRYAKAKCDLILHHSAATPTQPVPQIAGRDGASAAPSDEALMKDGEKWRALMGCARIRPLGSAGLDRDDEDHPDYGHMGLEIWTTYRLRPNWVEEAAREQALGVKWLERFAEKALRIAKEHSSQAQGELSVNPGVTGPGQMNEENQNG